MIRFFIWIVFALTLAVIVIWVRNSLLVMVRQVNHTPPVDHATPIESPTEQLRPFRANRMGRSRFSHDSGVFYTQYLPDGTRIVAADRKGISIWERATGKELNRFETADSEIQWLALSPDGLTLYILQASNAIDVWNINTGRQIHRLPIRDQGTDAIAISPDNTMLATASSKTWNVKLWDIAAAKLHWQAPGGYRIAFAPDGSSLVSGGFRDIYRWNLLSGRQVNHFCLPAFPNSEEIGLSLLVYSPNGKTLAIARADGPAALIDAVTGKEIHQFPIPQSNLENCVAFSPDGSVLAVTDQQGLVLWDVPNSREISAIHSPTRWPGSVGFSPNGKELVLGGAEDNFIDIVDTSTGKSLLAGDRARGSK